MNKRWLELASVQSWPRGVTQFCSIAQLGAVGGPPVRFHYRWAADLGRVDSPTSTLANAWVGCRSPGHHACLGVQSQRLRTARWRRSDFGVVFGLSATLRARSNTSRFSWRDSRGRLHALGCTRRTVPHQVVTAESVKEDHRPAFWDASPSDRHKPTPVDVAHR